MLNITGSHTDLAQEIKDEAFKGNAALEVEGIISSEEEISGIKISRLQVKSETAEKLLNKPCGTYITATMSKQIRETDSDFESSVKVLAALISELLPQGDSEHVLVAGLGNSSITADDLGPLTCDRVLVTRHITLSKEESFSKLFRPVSAIKPAVLGQTGVESAEVIKGLINMTQPKALIVIDALCAREVSRLGSTVQICDSGIVPGAGIGNKRQKINRESMGVPVISIGVPTVISALTLARDIVADDSAIDKDIAKKYSDMFVTPKDIDDLVKTASIYLGFALNHALQPDISLEDLRYYDGN